MLDYAGLEALAAVLREGSFERAARRLHVTPSAVSQRIKQLEERVGQVLVLRGQPYVEAARLAGVSHPRIIVRHILPATGRPLTVQAALDVGPALLTAAALSFLGLGQQPPAPSWGQMLNVAKNFMEQAPWMSVAPGICIFLAVLGFNLLGDGLRDALDPREN